MDDRIKGAESVTVNEPDATSSVAVVRAGYAALADGDMESVISQWDPDVVYWGYDENGQPKEFQSRDEFFGMVLKAAGKWETFANELVEAYPVGPELVMCHLRCTRKPPAGDPFVFEVAQMLQIKDGRIIRAAELVDSGTRAFYDSETHG